MKTVIALATLATGIACAAAPASAESLNVAGIVTPVCNVSVDQVTSGTLSIAERNEQKIGNLTLKCNSSGGTTLSLTSTNGDLLSGSNRINYNIRLGSPQEAAFAIAQQDTNPGTTVTRTRGGFSTAVARGVPLDFFMNVNLANEATQIDNNGTNQFAANAAPAGTYNEVFTFLVSGV